MAVRKDFVTLDFVSSTGVRYEIRLRYDTGAGKAYARGSDNDGRVSVNLTKITPTTITVDGGSLTTWQTLVNGGKWSRLHYAPIYNTGQALSAILT